MNPCDKKSRTFISMYPMPKESLDDSIGSCWSAGYPVEAAITKLARDGPTQCTATDYTHAAWLYCELKASAIKEDNNLTSVQIKPNTEAWGIRSYQIMK